MGPEFLRRPGEDEVVSSFLDMVECGPAVLLVEGLAGEGKTSLWTDAVDRAGASGIRVLRTAPAAGQSFVAYEAIADLLAGTGPVPECLPALQQVALQRVRQLDDDAGPPTDQRVVGVALLAVIDVLGANGPVLVAVDDAHWLDASSRAVLSFCIRRLRGRTGVLIAERSGAEGSAGGAWLPGHDRGWMARLRPRPFAPDELRELIGRHELTAPSRAVMTRIAEISGGNPFYALGLAAGPAGPAGGPVLPRALAELVAERVERLDRAVRDLLLVAACLPEPTVDVLARIAGAPTVRVLELLEESEADGIVTISGNRVGFTHPLLAHGVYTDADEHRRRAVHCAVAAEVTQPELRARHLALGAARADESTVAALDDAIGSAAARGAPSAAAELGELAIAMDEERGQDAVVRRIAAARNHFQAGDAASARRVLAPVLRQRNEGRARAVALNLAAALEIFDSHFAEAAGYLRAALAEPALEPAERANALMLLALSQVNTAMFDDALRSARSAVTAAEGHGGRALTSQALCLRAHLSFLYAGAYDPADMARALELEDEGVDVPALLRAGVGNALILAWTGHLDEALAEMTRLHEAFADRGADRDLIAVACYRSAIHWWRGDFAHALTDVEEAVRLAEQVGSAAALVIPYTVRAVVHAHLGRVRDATDDAEAVFTIAREHQATRIAEWPTMAMGLLCVSRGDHHGALAHLEPLLTHAVVPGREITSIWYLPDVVTALIGVGRLDDAERVVAGMEADGGRSGRTWLVAVAARGRAGVLAARGELPAALGAAAESLRLLDGVPMQFERARSLLVLGQVLRRQRKGATAADVFEEAARDFDAMGATLWAARAREELDRVAAARLRATRLTAAERDVAERAAAGKTNREVAAEMFLSPKTVETRLTSIYQKLGISSRSQLRAAIGAAGGSSD